MLPRIFEIEAGTSGRFTLWKNALERYEKNRFFHFFIFFPANFINFFENNKI